MAIKRQRITKQMREVTKENVTAILIIGGFNEEAAKAKVEAGYELAVKAMPNDDAKGIANYVAWY